MPAHVNAAEIDIETPSTRPRESRSRKPVRDTPIPLGDLRFCKLLGTNNWLKLPPTIRHRFSKRLQNGNTAVYVGHTTHMHMTFAGRILAQLTRLIGGPLPRTPKINAPCVVTVTEDPATGGQIWSRLYTRENGFPQVIHSSKRFSGPTGLEEYIGYGIGMALRIKASSTALTFVSDHYFVQLGPFRWALPRWLSPGDLTVGHHKIARDQFAFTLDLVHPMLGRLIHQRSVFADPVPQLETDKASSTAHS